MGMTIDETIIQAKLLKDGVGKDTYKYEILTSLIDIAKKYQKIQEIVEHWACCGNPSDSMIVISEVIEDGNVNFSVFTKF